RAGAFGEGGELLAEGGGVPGAQVDLVLVLQRDGNLLRHPRLLTSIGYLNRTRSTVVAASAQDSFANRHRPDAPTPGPRHRCNRQRPPLRGIGRWGQG